jgi:hypothetical protein
MHSAITAIDAELAVVVVAVMMMNKPLSHRVQYLIFIYANKLNAYIFYMLKLHLYCIFCILDQTYINNV